ncbi:unnamed protein product [Dibothriocephalus latus]|uniref:F-box domain-containing protein n=1 Tax=Dibothriocephalus latus TaxID=60516 RepID=A0A3P7MQY5_DIBLA|nr:unnamed protein product [Dibothriocephalus latus]
MPRILKYRVLKKPPLDIPQFCRVCADAGTRRYMPRLHCQSTTMVQDGEATVNFVACSLMSVEDNCVLHPLNLHDLHIHISPSGKRSSLTLHHAYSPSTSATIIPVCERQAIVRSPVETLIHSHCSEIRRLSIRLCKPESNQSKIDYFQHLPSLVRDHFLPALEKCGPNLRYLEVSAELIWACCSDVSTRQRLLHLQGKCVNVRKVTMIASFVLLLVNQQIRPSAKDICTYLNIFPSLEKVRIVTVDIFHDRTIHEILATCPHLRRLYIFSLRTLTFDFTTLPPATALELLFLEFSRLSVDNDFLILLNETLANLRSVKYLLLKFAYGTYPRVQTLKPFFANRPDLRWLVMVFHKGNKVLLCYADQDRRVGLKIIEDPAFQLGNLIHTYPELYDIFWSEFHKFSECLLY